MQYRKAKGFTLVELMLTLVIMTILVTLTLPSLNSLITHYKRQGAVHDLLGLFALAREHAVMNGTIVTVCPLDEQKQCGTNWNGEIHAFLDPGNTRSASSPHAILQTISPQGKGHFTVRSLHKSFFQFHPTGFTYSDLGNITWCPDSGDPTQATQIIISRGGRVRIARDLNGDGIPEDASGQPIRC